MLLAVLFLCFFFSLVSLLLFMFRFGGLNQCAGQDSWWQQRKKSVQPTWYSSVFQTVRIILISIFLWMFLHVQYTYVHALIIIIILIVFLNIFSCNFCGSFGRYWAWFELVRSACAFLRCKSPCQVWFIIAKKKMVLYERFFILFSIIHPYWIMMYFVWLSWYAEELNLCLKFSSLR